MRSSRSLSRLLTGVMLAASLAATASAQAPVATSSPGESVVPEPYRFGGEYTLHVASGVMIQGGDTEAFDPARGCTSAQKTVFDNTDLSSYYYTAWTSGMEWVDWGTISIDAASDIVSRVKFGYASKVLDPALGGPGATIEIRFYAHYQARCEDYDPNTATEVARFLLSGLPASPDGIASGYFLTLDLRGGQEFTVPKGVYGMGYRNPNGEQTGIIQSYAGEPGGDETTDPDANGQTAALDEWIPDVATGYCNGDLSLNWEPGTNRWMGSHYLRIDKYHPVNTPPAQALVRNDLNNSNPLTLFPVGTPVLGKPFSFFANAASPSDLGVFLFGFSQPFEYPTLYGTLLCDPGSPEGDLIGQLGMGGPHFFTSGFALMTLDLPPDGTLCGAPATVQAAQYGGPGLFRLTNAIDLTLGLY